MREVVLDARPTPIEADMVKESTPIFVKRDGRLTGVVVHLTGGWAVCGADIVDDIGSFSTRSGCLETVIKMGGQLYIDEAEEL